MMMNHLFQYLKNYLKKIEELTHRTIAIFSVGPDREQTIVLHPLFEEKK